MSDESSFDIFAIRDQLNEVAFEDGWRECCIGVCSELFTDMPAEHTTQELRKLEQLLRRNDLALDVRDDQLFVSQQLKVREVDPRWMARAMQAVSQITTIALEMVVPVVIGMWLDRKYGTTMLAPIGIAIGVPLGIWHLVKLSRKKSAGETVTSKES